MTRRAALSAIAGALAVAASPLDAAPRNLTWEQFLEHVEDQTLRHGDRTTFSRVVDVTCATTNMHFPMEIEAGLRADYNRKTGKWKLVEEWIDAR